MESVLGKSPVIFPSLQKTEVPEHSVFGASASNIWMNCHRQPWLVEPGDDQDSEASLLGTLAHERAEEYILTGNLNTENLDDDVIDGIRLYKDYVDSQSYKYRTSPMIEKKVVMTSVNRILYGTADCIFLGYRTLEVVDFKNGYVPVEADSYQMLFYAIATLDTLSLWDYVDQITTTVVQPRYEHSEGPIRSRTLTTKEARKWRERFREAWNRSKTSATTPGPHCKYCCVAPRCRNRIKQIIDVSFYDSLGKLSPHEMVEIFKLIPSIKTNLETIYNEVERLANEGKLEVSGYKLVKPIQRAKCSDEKSFVEEAGVDESLLYETKLKSMTKLKKIVKREVVEKYFVRPDVTSLKLVPVSDSRPAMSRSISFPKMEK